MEARYKCKWMQKMRWSQEQLFGVAVWMQQNEKQLVQTQWMHSENVIETQWHHKGLWEVSVQVQSMSYCVYTVIRCIPLAHQWSSRDHAVGDLTSLSRHPPFLLRVYQRRATTRTLCMLKLRGVTWHSTMFKAIPLRQDVITLLRRCRRL